MAEVYALLLFGLITGAVAHMQPAASALAITGVLAALSLFWIRERRAGECDEEATR